MNGTRRTLGFCAVMVFSVGAMCGNMVAPAAASDPADTLGGKHVLVIGIDGCRSDALQAAAKPNLAQLIANGTVCYRAYAGGHVGQKTEQRLGSGPGWASILTGVWADKHGVVNNRFTSPNLMKIVDGKNVGYPPFFSRIKAEAPNAYLASIVNWKPINAQLVFDVDLADNGSDAEVAEKCAELLLSDKNPTAIFLQFDDVDHVGGDDNGGGFTPKNPAYMEVIETTDRYVGTVLKAMRGRPNFANEDWLVLVTSDHGGLGTNHGNQTPEERTVFIIAAGGGFPQGKVVDAEWGIVAIPPTVFQHLGIPIDSAWGLESPPFGQE